MLESVDAPLNYSEASRIREGLVVFVPILPKIRYQSRDRDWRFLVFDAFITITFGLGYELTCRIGHGILVHLVHQFPDIRNGKISFPLELHQFRTFLSQRHLPRTYVVRQQ